MAPFSEEIHKLTREDYLVMQIIQIIIIQEEDSLEINNKIIKQVCLGILTQVVDYLVVVQISKITQLDYLVIQLIQMEDYLGIRNRTIKGDYSLIQILLKEDYLEIITIISNLQGDYLVILIIIISKTVVGYLVM